MTHPGTALADAHVFRCLNQWGDEFRLAREFEPSGKNVLAILIEHKGEIPRREGGYRPEINISPMAWQIETIVTSIHRRRCEIAAVLRAYYCGSGRHRVERRMTAEAMCGQRISPRGYYLLHDAGVCWIIGALEA
jgi:hypothetical protein